MKAGPTNKKEKGLGVLSNKGIIVTGGASPFGLLLAQSLVREGASVLLSCFSEQSQPFYVDLGVQDMPASVVWATGDSRDPNYCNAIVRYAYQRFGRLDGVINNSEFEFLTIWSAGIKPGPSGPPSFHPVNVMENFNRAIVGFMRPGGGLIHTLAHDAAARPVPHPLLHPTTRQRPERILLEQGIRVMVIQPGPTRMRGFFDRYPLMFFEEQPEEVYHLTQNYIAFLAEE